MNLQQVIQNDLAYVAHHYHFSQSANSNMFATASTTTDQILLTLRIVTLKTNSELYANLNSKTNQKLFRYLKLASIEGKVYLTKSIQIRCSTKTNLFTDILKINFSYFKLFFNF